MFENAISRSSSLVSGSKPAIYTEISIKLDFCQEIVGGLIYQPAGQVAAGILEPFCPNFALAFSKRYQGSLAY